MAATIRLIGLHVYRLKSAAPEDRTTTVIGREGLPGDREMMAVNADGRAVTARGSHGLLRISVRAEGTARILTAPGFAPLVLDLRAVAPPRDAKIWGDTIAAHDLGDTSAGWLTQVLGHPARLVLKDPAHLRETPLRAGAPVALPDTAPLLLATTGSLAAINDHLDLPAPMRRFRPNLVIEGAAPFAEDGWAVLRIGDVVFDVVAPCDRCVMITLGPDGQPDAAREPLGILSRLRRAEDGNVLFGQFLIPRTTGRLHLGDTVEVLETKAPPRLKPAEPPPARLKLPARPDADTAARRDLELTCIAVIDETPGFRTFRFTPSAPFTHLPGQFITIRPEIDGSRVARSYTISSSPSRPAHLSISVRRVSGGLVSNWLHDHLRPGDRIAASGPGGRFHLARVPEGSPILLAAAGSGVTPLISTLRYVADHAMALDIHAHLTMRHDADRPFRDELADLARLTPGLRVTWNLTGPGQIADPSGGVLTGRLDPEMAATLIPDLANRTVMICGPDGYRRGLRAIWAAANPPPDRIWLEESFGADPGAGATLPPIGDYAVRFDDRKPVAGSGTTTLLALSRAAGVPIRSDCEAGICGSCKCRVQRGDWRVAANCADPDWSVLSAEERESGVVLACSTSPIGEVEVETL